MNDHTQFINKDSEAEELLHSHNLRKTTCRHGIIEILSSSSEALTENEIKILLDSSHDRTTIYRSFKTLLENNLIHKIVVDNQLVKYALNPQSAAFHEHVHFYCKKCEKLVCIEDSSFTGLSLPAGYKVSETEIIVKGTCGRCEE